MTEQAWTEVLEEVPPENRALAQAGMLAGERIKHPDDRNPRGIYESGEKLWVTPFSRFKRLKCRLFGHRTETLPLLSLDAERVGDVQWCRSCTSIISLKRPPGETE